MRSSGDPPRARAKEAGVLVRRAALSDLRGVWDILYGIEYGEGEYGPDRTDIPPLFEHELTTGEMWVAEANAAVVAYAALIPRSAVGFIGEFFVRKEYQSHGIGTALLRHLFRDRMEIYCTMSSRNPSALALYIRAGLTPQWPHFQFVGNPRSAMEHGQEIQVIEASPGDPELVKWDERISGRFRPQEHYYWQARLHAIPFWCQRHGAIVGYVYVQPKARSGRQPGRMILGPIGAVTTDDADACTRAMVNWARPHAEELQIAVPSAHPSLPRLINAGFRFQDVETFCSSSAAPVINPRAYIASTTPEGTSLL